MVKKETLFPVLLAVPESARKLPAPSRVKYLSRHARKALAASAQKSNIELGELKKDADGRPLPFDGIHWSLTHKTEYVGAVVSQAAIGIDLEKAQPRRTRGLFGKAASAAEWQLAGGQSWDNFHRFWTAKEAVLKAVGVGLKDLSTCRVVEVIDTYNLVIAYHDRLWPVEHCFFEGHVASIVKSGGRVQWTLLKHPH
jgi:4'-phosphopantetheinyl transferase